MNIALGTVYYSSAKEYLSQFLKSLEEQKFKDFTLLMINDSREDIRKALRSRASRLNAIVVDIKQGMSQAESRSILINEAYKAKTDLLIFQDIDDCCDRERIGLISKGISGYDFVFNNIILTDHAGEKRQDGEFIRKDLQKNISGYKELLDKNMLGLSNTAIDLKKAHLNGVNIPKDIIAVDWWIFTTLLLGGLKGGFIKDTSSFYRQHSNNLIGGIGVLDERRLDTGLNVKRAQYRYFSKLGYKEYALRLDAIDLLDLFLKGRGKKKAYIECVNMKLAGKKLVWWENIKTIKELGLA